MVRRRLDLHRREQHAATRLQVGRIARVRAKLGVPPRLAETTRDLLPVARLDLTEGDAYQLPRATRGSPNDHGSSLVRAVRLDGQHVRVTLATVCGAEREREPC